MKDDIEKSIIRGAKEALAFAKGEADTKKYKVHIPDEINVKKIRNKLNMSQSEFAEHFGLASAHCRNGSKAEKRRPAWLKTFWSFFTGNPKRWERLLFPKNSFLGSTVIFVGKKWTDTN